MEILLYIVIGGISSAVLWSWLGPSFGKRGRGAGTAVMGGDGDSGLEIDLDDDGGDSADSSDGGGDSGGDSGCGGCGGD